MDMKNIPTFEETHTAEEQIDHYVRQGDYPSILKAASVKARVQGDAELSDTLSLLSAQLDFSGDDYENESVARTRNRLAKIIKDRRGRMHMGYHSLMTDEDALSVFGKEVTKPETVDYATGTIVEGGLLDPAIFGGAGVIGLIPKGDEPPLVRVPYGTRMGYITLPGKFLVPGFEAEAATLTGRTAEDIGRLVRYSAYLVTESDDPSVKPWSIIGEKQLFEARERGSVVKTEEGAHAVELLLESLGLPDHPEKMVFSILPVTSPSIRRVYFIRECARYRDVGDLNDVYRHILYRIGRIRTLEEIGAPAIILRNEMRMIQDYLDILWFGSGETEDKDEITGLSGMLRVFRKHDFRRGCREIVSARRCLLGGYVPAAATSEPAPVRNPGFFPETVTLVGKNSQSSIPYRKVIEVNTGAAENAGFFEFEDDAEDNGAPAGNEEPAGGMSGDDIYEETEKIRIACANRRGCRVRFDPDSGIYVLAS